MDDQQFPAMSNVAGSFHRGPIVAIDAFVANYMFLLVKNRRSVCPRKPYRTVRRALLSVAFSSNEWSSRRPGTHKKNKLLPL